MTLGSFLDGDPKGTGDSQAVLVLGRMLGMILDRRIAAVVEERSFINSVRARFHSAGPKPRLRKARN
jgi:hypothetical protein